MFIDGATPTLFATDEMPPSASQYFQMNEYVQQNR